ncbi:Bromodomain-containing protein 8 [Psilocybe cubensis]|uniref:Bromodomain-containing protein 8 n=1 Tax=Psilocybe cubensis TaxID=181762 RepID=A0ACB8H462_PSICU|nr:Bromodomain-containing protein 8 [Psilocybe cubensis]KAH9482693.1 Bromodomain-containing protein 8 [Psilocybe cubensis]
MSARASRRPAASLNSIESLLLAQSVWDLGASQATWAPISKILSKHPLLSRPKSFFTPQSCHSINETTVIPHASVNLDLARKHYHARFLELQGLILNEETKFKAVLKEIEEIRAGIAEKQDSDAAPTESSPQSRSQPSQSETKVVDELFSGSDLSGVTESAESNPSQSQPENSADDLPVRTDKGAQNTQTKDAATPFVEMSQITEETALGGGLSPHTPQNPAQDVGEESQTNFATPQPHHDPQEHLEAVESLPMSKHMSAPNNAEEPLPFNLDDEIKNQGRVSLDASNHKQISNNKQEEEEEEAIREGKNEEEEEEEVEEVEEIEKTSQGQTESDVLEKAKEEQINVLSACEDEEMKELSGDDIKADTEQNTEEELPSPSPHLVHNKNFQNSLDPKAARSPVAETVGSDAEPTPDEGLSSEMEEPVAPARRSSRRRKSSAASVPPPQSRSRLRPKGRPSETLLQTTMAIDSDNDGDLEGHDGTPHTGEERASSPYDSALTRRNKRKASFLESAGSPHDKKRLREDSEPVDEEEPGPSSHNLRARISRHGTRTEEQVAMKRFQSVIGMLHSQISQHRNGNIFHNPIKNSEAPDYHDIVKRPMDLKTIKTRVKDGVIANSLEFQRDIYLMFANAMMYNRPGSDVHAMAEDMMLESEGQINAFRQTEGLVKRGQRP